MLTLLDGSPSDPGLSTAQEDEQVVVQLLLVRVREPCGAG